ncbi:MAG: hypothetical protein JXQ75_02700 [Phycisphaerae bacterium]|nr:hypothetical protein [Phycisphaerae bacterium]
MKTFGYMLLMTVLLSTGIAIAQVKPDSTHIDAMKKLGLMLGEWKGQGWIEQNSGERNDFLASISVKKELEGVVLFLDVRFTVMIPNEKSEIVVHRGFDIISYDKRAEAYRVHGFDINGQFGSGTAQIVNGVFRISMKEEGNEVRFWRSNIDVSKNGVWHDITEESKDGKSWKKSSEITMKRVERH